MSLTDIADLTEFSIICRDLLRTLALADLTDCCRRSARAAQEMANEGLRDH